MNFWQTDEVGAWQRDFTYEEYLTLKKISNQNGAPLSFDGYSAFCHLLDIELEDQLK